MANDRRYILNVIYWINDIVINAKDIEDYYYNKIIKEIKK